MDHISAWYEYDAHQELSAMPVSQRETPRSPSMRLLTLDSGMIRTNAADWH